MFHVLVHYHELALKGRNRKHFEYRFVHHIRRALKPLTHVHVDPLQGRIRVSFEDETAWPRLEHQLKRVFGVVNFSLTRSIPLPYDNPDLTALKDAIKSDLPTYGYDTFRVSAKRADKRFSKTSMEVEQEIGAAVVEQTGKRVQLKNPDLEILVELVPPEAYYTCHREAGPGGLPTGTGGKLFPLSQGGLIRRSRPTACSNEAARPCSSISTDALIYLGSPKKKCKISSNS